MSLSAAPGLRTVRGPARAATGVAIAGVAVACAALVAVRPTATLVVLALLIVMMLAVVAPEYGLVGAVLVYGFEGVIKVGLARELPSVGVSPEALGAALLDLTLFVGVAGVAFHDRGRTLLVIWRRAGRAARVALGALAAWLVLSVLQMPTTGDLHTALEGLRLTQAYALTALAGAMLFARCRPEPVVAALVGVLLAVAAYAAFRGIAGPDDGERLAVLGRATTSVVPSDDAVIFRNAGSFSSAIGLSSFLVPAGVFLFALGMLMERLRLAAWIGVALVLVALLDTYVRASLAAIALGAVCALFLATFASGSRSKLALRLATVPLLVALLAAGALAPAAVTGGSQQIGARSSGVFQPQSDESLSLRFERWGDTLEVVKKKPLGTGVGSVGGATIDTQGSATFTDNSYLKVLQEQGPLGALCFMLGVFVTLFTAATAAARRSGIHRRLGVAAAGGAVSFFVLGGTSEAIEQPGKVLAWLLVGIALWAAYGMSERSESAAEEAA